MDDLVTTLVEQILSAEEFKNSSFDINLLLDNQKIEFSLGSFLSENNLTKALLAWYKNDLPKSKSDLTSKINSDINEIDHLINDQLNLIIQNSYFKKLEASWRGLWYLAFQSSSHRNIKLRFLDITWLEVCRDIEKSLDFDQSQLFQKIYNEEYGTPGGEPYGVLIGDYEVSHKRSLRQPNDDIAVLSSLSQIAAASFSPFIANVSSEIFGLDSFSTLGMPINLQSVFKQKEYIHWRALREKPDSRFIGLTLPKVLLRAPYRTTPGSYKGVFYFDNPTKKNISTSLWGNASYAFAGILIREFANVGWFGHIRGVPRDQIGGGLVTNFRSDFFESDTSRVINKPVVDVIITDSQERELSDLGMIPLCHCYDTSYAAFYSNQSVQLPKSSNKYGDVNAKISSMLQHVLCASRIAHYLKVMIRDKIGSFITAEECERFLSEWLFRYTTGRDDLDWEEQARYPLRKSTVKVEEHPDKPGQYFCVINLVPHYQIDQMVSELELVTELVQVS